jgi:hypothetical protein
LPGSRYIYVTVYVTTPIAAKSSFRCWDGCSGVLPAPTSSPLASAIVYDYDTGPHGFCGRVQDSGTGRLKRVTLSNQYTTHGKQAGKRKRDRRGRDASVVPETTMFCSIKGRLARHSDLLKQVSCEVQCARGCLVLPCLLKVWC